MRAVDYAEKAPQQFRRGDSWKINLFGQNSDVPSPALQAFRIDLNANQVLDAHLHIVDQFQVFIAGSGRIGRDTAQILTVHYADHHTGYGPLVAGPQGLSYLTLRSKTDAGLVKLSRPDLREHLRPSAKRHCTSQPVTLSIEPVLRDRTAPAVEPVIDGGPEGGGMSAVIVRLGPGQSLTMPDPATGGGQYLVVVNGAIVDGTRRLAPFSLVWVDPAEPPATVEAAEGGAEVLLTQFPVQDDWMRSIV